MHGMCVIDIFTCQVGKVFVQSLLEYSFYNVALVSAVYITQFNCSHEDGLDLLFHPSSHPEISLKAEYNYRNNFPPSLSSLCSALSMSFLLDCEHSPASDSILYSPEAWQTGKAQ